MSEFNFNDFHTIFIFNHDMIYWDDNWIYRWYKNNITTLGAFDKFFYNRKEITGIILK